LDGIDDSEPSDRVSMVSFNVLPIQLVRRSAKLYESFQKLFIKWGKHIAYSCKEK